MKRWGHVYRLLGAAVGLIVGLGTYIFIYARGASYMTNDPAACANCHIMDEQYAGWTRSSHHAVATCNDCHTPHNFVGKWLAKASNGWHHSVAFTTGRFHEPIMITPRNRAVTEAACRDCHEQIVEAIDAMSGPHGGGGGEPMDCLRCHDSVGHLH